MADRAPVSNPKVRTTGAVLLLLALLAYVSSATGWDAHGGTGRIVLAVVATVLLVPGVALVRTRVSGVSTLSADDRGITVGLRGRGPFTVPWHDVEAVWLRRVDPLFGGHLLYLQLAPGAPAGVALRQFEQREADGTVVALLGLNAAQGRAVPAQLAAGGDRYRGIVGRNLGSR